MCSDPEFAQTGYEKGVPMGSRLPAAQPGKGGPVFAVSALSDPGTERNPGGQLAKIQIIKGWVDDQGAFHQAVHDVALGPDQAASVDRSTCEPVGGGARALCGVWQDPDFEPDRDAVYYARVIENPSCRWSRRLCLSLPEADRPDGCDAGRLPETIQERAWTSPIWYAVSDQGA